MCFGFVTAQQHARAGRRDVVRISDGGSGLSAATVRRQLATVSAFYGYLITWGDVGVEVNPVPRGLQHVWAATLRRPWAAPGARRAASAAHLGTRWRWTALMGALRKGAGPGHGAGHGARRTSPLQRCWAFASMTSVWVSGGCSSPTARVAISVWCRCRPSFLRHGRLLHGHGATQRASRNRPGLRRAQGPPTVAGR